MSRLITNPVVNVSAVMRLTEQELAALDALAGYGIEPFLEVFYAKMGRHYLTPHENGLRTLFETIHNEVPTLLRRAQDAREAFCPKPKPQTPPPESEVRP